ncbi:MAG: acyl-ACP--UDP-N-acetylglucosamine O-acyltransferase [Deltaproteobacteria bacterium]|nr:acyl-ACP--UDP-N-acetylglucosamine O-acyltransferase [Deltaproteobacteria bacterium]
MTAQMSDGAKADFPAAAGFGGVDPRAAIDPSAEVGEGATVGPYAVVGAGVSIGAGCVIHAHAVVQGPTVLGPGNAVHPFACLGGEPQDLRYRGEPTTLVVGRDNIFREHVTVNRGTEHGGGSTRIGDSNLFMACCHVAHDCAVGDHVVMANHATLAGHVSVGDHAVFGGMAAVGPFLRVGESAMVAAGAMLERDAPPFCIVAGDRARLRAINRVGLARRGIGSGAHRQIKAIFAALRERGRPVADIVADWGSRQDLSPEAGRMIEFLAAAQRGVAR